MRLTLGLLLGCTLVTGCSTTDPLDAALPTLPPVGGAAVAVAGRLTAANFEQERVKGPASQGLAGDYFMRNDKVRLVVQAPGRAIGPCPFGGNVIDYDTVDAPAGDQLGEVSPFMQLGRTLNYDRVEIVRDGSKGGPAVIRMWGHDAKNDFINLPGLGSFAIGIADDYRADIDLKWRAAVTYILMPGESKLRMIYTFHNPGKFDAATLWGTLSDTGAGAEIFHSGLGFGELGFDDIVGTSKYPLVKYVALQNQGVAYGIVPILEDKAVAGASVPIAGVDVEVYAIKDQFDAFGADGQSLKLTANGTATREVDLVIGKDVAAVSSAAFLARGDMVLPFAGTVAAGAGARVAVIDAASFVVTTATADENGSFSGTIPPGTYTFQAEGDGYRRGPAVQATVPAMDVALTIPAAVKLQYTVKDRSGAGIPARITVVGAPAASPDRKFLDAKAKALPHGIANWTYTRNGDSALGTAFDQPLTLVPGHYRVVVSRGPEWSRFEQVLDVTTAGGRIDAVLDRIAPTPGYIAADFHQHSYISPDASAPPEHRLMSYLADGADFISSSEHDVIFDYAPLIEGLNARDLIDSSIGCEITAWDYGHFIAFPLDLDPLSPNGGAFDWAGGEMNLSIPPPRIFDGLRAIGAQVIQVNHPRSSPGDFSSFQQSFDRAGLKFDFAGRSFGGDAKLMPVSAFLLGVPEDEPMFSTKFDTVEIFNGHHVPQMPTEGERIDTRVDINLRDWMNFLSFGFTPVPTGVSDAHGFHADPGALPRTLVRVPDDSQAAINAGVADAVVNTLVGAVPHDVVVTNGPFLQFTVDGKGIGSTVTHPSGPLAMKVTVVTAGWAPVDTVEIFANNTFDIPVPKGMAQPTIFPALCYTTRAVPSMRCQMAIGGARPFPAGAIKLVEVIPGNAATTRQEISLDITDVDADMLIARQRAGGLGKDVWLVARVLGDTGLFPVIPNQFSGDVTAAVDNLNLVGNGIPALAFTHAIFVDVDGNGWRGPFQP